MPSEFEELQLRSLSSTRRRRNCCRLRSLNVLSPPALAVAAAEDEPFDDHRCKHHHERAEGHALEPISDEPGIARAQGQYDNGLTRELAYALASSKGGPRNAQFP